MRWFWIFLVILIAGGLWFVLSEPVPVELPQPDSPASVPPTNSEPPASPPPPAAIPAPELDLLGESGSIVRPKPVLLTDTRSPNDVVRRIDDRTLELDGRFRIVGNGRADDPYRISWELLTSSNSYVDAAVKALTPPPWVRALDGTYIEISGYYSTAVRVSAAKNLLLTLNRWDGCCIGLPPTPFDAVDMDMRAPVMMQGLHLFRFGTFRGRLVVSPFETGGFLLGLYRLEDTTFEQ
ncbi:MAG: hypothetical protein RLZZ116_232 [Planctomycetota bacterium]|jgi:hypothetical protein